MELSFTDLVRSYTEKLNHIENVWDRSNLSQEYRYLCLHDMSWQIEAAVNDVVDIFERNVCKLQSETLQYEEGIRALCGLLCIQKRDVEEDLPLDLKARLYEAQYKELVQLKNDRIAAINAARSTVLELYDDLGEKDFEEPASDIGEEDFSQSRPNKLLDHAALLLKRKGENQTIIHELQKKVRDVRETLDIAPSELLNEGDAIIFADYLALPASQQTIQKLQCILSRCETERDQNKQQIEHLRKKIVAVCSRLKFSATEEKDFLLQAAPCSKKTVSSLQETEAILERQKEERIEELMCTAIEELHIRWHELGMFADETSAFVSSVLEAPNDVSLEAVERERRRVDEILMSAKDILILIKRVGEIENEKVQYEVTIADSSRLLSKKRSAQESLNEERQRKVIEKELPRVREALRTRLVEWEADRGQAFMYGGKRYLDKLVDDEANEVARKDEIKKLREREKAERLEHDLRFGSSALTPAKPACRPRHPHHPLSPPPAAPATHLTPRINKNTALVRRVAFGSNSIPPPPTAYNSPHKSARCGGSGGVESGCGKAPRRALIVSKSAVFTSPQKHMTTPDTALLSMSCDRSMGGLLTTLQHKFEQQLTLIAGLGVPAPASAATTPSPKRLPPSTTRSPNAALPFSAIRTMGNVEVIGGDECKENQPLVASPVPMPR